MTGQGVRIVDPVCAEEYAGAGFIGGIRRNLEFTALDMRYLFFSFFF